MAYIGNQQTEGFSSIPAKQDLTGASGTSLTLSHAVANAESISLFINNVRQEPTTAYSATGTAVTLTGSVVATDDIYVVYNSLALQTTVPPDASVSTAKIIDGSVTSAKLDTNIAITGDLTVDTSTLKVDSTNNRVGIGTASPTKKVSASIGLNDTDGFALEYSGEAKAGMFVVPATGEVRMGAINSSGTYFSTFYANNSEAMRIDSSGNLLIGVTSFTSGGGGVKLGGTQATREFSATGTGAIQQIGFHNPNGEVGSIYSSGSSTVFATSSDYRLKENIDYTWDATTRLKQLKPARFNFIDDDTNTLIDGFIAHEAATVVPEAVIGTKDAVNEEGNIKPQGIDASKLVPLLCKTIQELEARITALEAS